MKTLILSLLSALPLALISPTTLAAERIVSLGGSVTEIIYALKQEKNLVGIDSSSIYPDATQQLPKVGYYRSIPVEGVAALNPSLLLSSEIAGPKKSLDALAQLGIQIQTIPDRPSIDSLYQRIQTIADILNISEDGKQLLNKTKQDIDSAITLPAQKLDTIFIINRTGSLMAAGSETSADEIMKLAGVNNIFSHQKGFKPIANESLASAKPELIIITEFSAQNSGEIDRLKSLPALIDSPAVKNNRILVLDDLLAMTLGPRTGEAIRQIKNATLMTK